MWFCMEGQNNVQFEELTTSLEKMMKNFGQFGYLADNIASLNKNLKNHTS